MMEVSALKIHAMVTKITVFIHLSLSSILIYGDGISSIQSLLRWDYLLMSGMFFPFRSLAETLLSRQYGEDITYTLLQVYITGSAN